MEGRWCAFHQCYSKHYQYLDQNFTVAPFSPFLAEVTTSRATFSTADVWRVGSFVERCANKSLSPRALSYIGNLHTEFTVCRVLAKKASTASPQRGLDTIAAMWQTVTISPGRARRAGARWCNDRSNWRKFVQRKKTKWADEMPGKSLSELHCDHHICLIN